MLAREHGLAVGVAFNPATAPEEAAAFASAARAEIVLCMSIWPGYSGQPFMPEALARIERLAALVSCPIQVDGGVGEENVGDARAAGATCSSPGAPSSPIASLRPRTAGWPLRRRRAAAPE